MLVFTIVGYLTPTTSVGETLAWEQGRLGSARQAMAGWLDSPEHRASLSTPRWRDLGVARLHAASLFGLPDVTVWVGQFGTRRLASPLP